MGTDNQHFDNAYSTLLNLVDNTQTFAGILSLDGTLLFCNAAPLKAMSMESRDVEGKKFWDCSWWSYDAQVQASIKKDYEVAAAGTITNREIQFQTTEGLHRIEYNSVPVFNDVGEVINVVVEGRSVEQRKQAEQALVVSQQEYKGFFEDLDEAFLLHDDHVFIECNMAAVRMLGYTTKEELKNKHPGELSPAKQPDGRDSFEKALAMEAIAFKNGSHRFEWTLLRNDGSPIDIEVLATPVQFGGKTLLHSVWRDLTGIKQQQKALQQSELRYRNLFEKSADALMISEGDRFIYCNEAAVKMFGYSSKEEMTSLPQSAFSPVVQPDGQDSFEKATEVTAAAFKAGSLRFEWLHKRKNGEAFPVEVLLTAISEDGKPLLHIVLRDISKHKKQQKALLQSELRYRSLFEKPADAFVLVENGRFIDANEATLELLGYDTVDELINVSPVDLSPPTQPDGSDSQIKGKKVLADCYRKDSYRFEWVYLRKGGESISVEVLTTLIPVADGLVLHAILRDLTEVKKQQKALEESKLQHRTFFDKSSDAFVLLSERKFVDVNDATVKMLGYTSKKELLSVHPATVSPAVQADGRDSAEKADEMMGIALEKGSHRFEWLHQRKNGEVFPLEVSLTRIIVDDKPVLHTIFRDLTDVKRQQQALFNSERKYKALFEQSADALIISAGDKFLDCNEAAFKMLGYSSKQEMLGVHPAELSPAVQPDGRDSFVKAREVTAVAFEKGSNRFEWYHKRKNGDVFPVEVTTTAIPYGEERLLHIVWRDITEMKRQQETLQHLAHYDSLTGLPNRVLFADRFQQATAHSKRTDTQLAVCFLDLDNFKPINDTFGHDVGDALLIEVAQRITASIREEDTVSRQGGDEFTLLLGGLNSYQECEQLIDRMLHNLCEPYIIGGHAHSVTASCGITLYPTDDGDIDLLVRHADHAMYEAKLEGKNTFAFFNADTERSSQQHMAFLQRVSQAIVNDELLLHYQPKIDMRSGHMFGAEALIRWQHPDDGLISPFGFLPKIENTHVMIEVGNWVIEQALVQLSQWCKAGKDWVISINIDAYHFMQTSFVDDLKQALTKHLDVPAKQLEIEILETVAFDNLEQVSATINACQALGVSFALDDFGTGYSSLAYLKGLPVQWLKIDQSFVRDMLEDEQDLALIEGIVSLSKAFKREVIAEGVETVEHGSALLKLGCYNAQGYGIAKPMPAQELLPWQENYQADKSWTRYSKMTLVENDL